MNETTVPSHRLMVLMFTDVKGSVDIKMRLGNAAYLRLIARHDGLLREIVDSIHHADILKDTGDGFLVRFETASAAVVAALRFQHEIHEAAWDPEPIEVRIGLHIGEVAEVKEATGQPKLVALAADIASRVMDLAQPGQILLTRTAFDDARQFVREYPVSVDGDRPQLQWAAHGLYKFKGSDEPLEVFEVGVVGIGPLKAPEDSAKASRALSQGEADMLGWRPATGQGIPKRPNWRLERKLGEGGFGEVWLARQQNTGFQRVFKFCFDPERVRSLKHELALFQLIRDALGERPDIARLLDVQLDSPPYYLESEFTDGGNLLDWAETQGGLAEVDLGIRLEIVAKVADAMAAAHSVYVLHHDIKPKNILIETGGSAPQPRLADFGIGMISNRFQLKRHSITMTGLGSESSEAGSLMYMPPESLAGKPFTRQGDIYALGVLLYQLVVADTDRPVGFGWERDVDDEILRQDIAACVDQDPDRRLGNAWDLADRIRRHDERRDELLKSRRRRRMARVGSLVTAVLVVLLTVVVVYSLQVIESNAQLDLAHARAHRAERFGKELLKLVNLHQPEDSPYTVLEILDATVATTIDWDNLKDEPLERALVYDMLGDVYNTLGYPEPARKFLRGAVELRGPVSGADPRQLLSAIFAWAKLLHKLQEYEEGEKAYRDALGLCEAEGSSDFCAGVKDSYARLLIETKQYDKAKTYALDAIDAMDNDDPRLSNSLTNLATIHQNLEEHDKALELFKRALEVRRAQNGDRHATTLSAVNNLATFLYTVDKFTEAEAHFRHGWETAQESLVESNALIYSLSGGLGACLTERGAFSEAEPQLLESYRKLKLLQGDNSLYADRIRLYLVHLYDEWGKPTKADEWRERSPVDAEAANHTSGSDSASSID